jgi:serpin B
MKNYKLFGMALLAAVGLCACSDNTAEEQEIATSTTGSQQEEQQGDESQQIELSDLVLTDAEAGAVSTLNDFSFKVFNSLTFNDAYSSEIRTNNELISPLSISSLMTILANGADGETLNGLLSSLCISDHTATLDDINSLNGKLLSRLPLIDPTASINLANSLWLANSLNVKDDFINSNAESYNSEIYRVNFAKDNVTSQINEWVYDKTNGMIVNPLKSALAADSKMALANATYFKGEWSDKFTGTKSVNFENVDGSKTAVQLMKRNGSFAYYECQDFAYAAVPFGYNRYEFDIIRPNDGVSLDNVIKSMDFTKFGEIVATASEADLSLSMPMLSQEHEFEMRGILSAMGASDTFSSKPNFSKISDDLITLSMIQHNTAINLNEYGAEVAASTIAGSLGSAETITTPVYKDFTVDRPYLYVIRESKHNVIIFIGAVYTL